MKKVIFCATAFVFLLGMANMASAAGATFTSAATTLLNGINFAPSASVSLGAFATNTAWSGTAKHTSGGTTMYGMLSSDVTIKMALDQLPAGPVVQPTADNALPNPASGSWK